MGCRGVIFLLIFGGILFGYGWSEWTLSKGASATPEAITIEELEKGPPSNPYRVVGEHVPLPQGLIYEYEKKSNKVNYAFYPVTSKKELEDAVEAAAKKHGGDVDKVTNEEVLNALNIAVVIKTDRWKNVDAIKKLKTADFPTKDINGMVINTISSIGTRDTELIRSSIKNFDPQKVVIFEVDRKPSSTGFAMGLMGAGALLMVGALLGGLIFRKPKTVG